MLPADWPSQRSLADVSREFVSPLLSPPADVPDAPRKRAFVVVDGLGAQLIRSHSGHAHHLSRALETTGEVVHSGLPSTTASALGTITTGALPGQHGLVGYQVRDPDTRQVVNHLKPYPEPLTPAAWQPEPTFFELLGGGGIPSRVVAEGRFEGTDFTRSILRGAEFVSSYALDDHLNALRTFFDLYDEGLCYVYWPAIDRMGHQRGVDSAAWVDALEVVDGFIGQLVDLLAPGEQALVLADHGMVDVSSADHAVLPSEHPLRSAVATWAGEPRFVHLYLHDPTEAPVVAQELQLWLGERAGVITREESLHRGWFGPVRPEHEGRIGDVVMAASGAHAIYDEATATPGSLTMIGQHGSVTAVETQVPAIRLMGPN